ncbi:hypothetical protein CFC21_003087 [Triticum aestivum]|nr:uncharacterized protein LOC123159134 [Triticum aestivum]KAF6985191.1 hypothetical protein CFC21_003087 [Triticum aestivum]VAH08495.1 unnamed protein product [Triticum turgidum subsp. durum]
MPAGGAKTRFGRCPYCRAMICQSTSAAIYYCTKCRTPIRGKNTEPTDDETDNALSSLEILSAVDTESVFSDELEGSSTTQPSVIDVDGDQPPFSCGYNSNSDANSQGIAAASSPSPHRGFGSPRAGKPRSNSCLPRGVEDGLIGSDGQDEVRVVRPVNSRVDALRASSRRTRRALSASDPSILRRRDFSVPDPEEAPRNASSGQQQLRQSALSSRELRTSASVSAATASPLTDPAFQRDLLHALDKLRGMIASIELQPRQASGGSGAVTRRDSRLFRRLESRLAEELPADSAAARGPRRNGYSSAGSASWSSSASSSSGQGERHAARPQRRRHCLPVLGGAPFVVCGECSELLQAPTSAVPSRRRGSVRLRCGGCEKVLEVALPAVAGTAGPARRTSGVSGSGELERAASRSGGAGAQQVPLLLHRALGYDSMSQLLQSRRY